MRIELHISSSLKTKTQSFHYVPTINTDHIMMPLISLKYIIKIKWV